MNAMCTGILSHMSLVNVVMFISSTCISFLTSHELKAIDIIESHACTAVNNLVKIYGNLVVAN